jgi:hypothetical protein
VTSSTMLRADKLQRVLRIGDTLGTKSLVIVHPGIRAERMHGVRTIPLEDFLLNPNQIGSDHD